MGFKISYVAFEGAPKEKILDTLGVRDTGTLDEYNEAPLTGTELPDGRFLVFANDFGFALPQHLERLSALCRVVGCQVEEGIMASIASSYQNRALLWEVGHDSNNGLDDLWIEGAPPPQFESIRQRLMQEQAAEPVDAEYPVDHIFDIPVQMVEQICGYRYGMGQFAWGEPSFTWLEPVVPLDSVDYPWLKHIDGH
jgi:hypothetical protein